MALVGGVMDAGFDELVLHFGPGRAKLTKLGRTSATIVEMRRYAPFLCERIQWRMPLRSAATRTRRTQGGHVMKKRGRFGNFARRAMHATGGAGING